MTPRPIVRAAATAALALTALAAVAPGARAHGGDAQLELGTDGAGGVTAHLTWTDDGHPVEETATVSVTARSDDGDVVGPLTLALTPEGVGWYAGDSGALATGHWTLEATASGAADAATTTQVDVAPPPEPPAADPEGTSDASTADDAEPRADAPSGPGSEPGGSGASTEPADVTDAGPADATGARSAAPTADGASPATLPLAAAGVLVAAGAATVVVRARRRRT